MKKDGRNRNAIERSYVRKQVIAYLKKKKGTQQKAAEIFSLSLAGIEKIWRNYKKDGKKWTGEDKRGGRKGKKLNNNQAIAILKLIKAVIMNANLN